MLRLWSLYRGSGMGGGHLPGRGGAADQAAIMVDAFAIMDDAAARMEKKSRN